MLFSFETNRIGVFDEEKRRMVMQTLNFRDFLAPIVCAPNEIDLDRFLYTGP